MKLNGLPQNIGHNTSLSGLTSFSRVQRFQHPQSTVNVIGTSLDVSVLVVVVCGAGAASARGMTAASQRAFKREGIMKYVLWIAIGRLEELILIECFRK